MVRISEAPWYRIVIPKIFRAEPYTNTTTGCTTSWQVADKCENAGWFADTQIISEQKRQQRRQRHMERGYVDFMGVEGVWAGDGES
jgi:hypothetical protein